MYFIIRKTQVVAGPFRTTAEVSGIDLQVGDAFACAETGYIRFRYSGVQWVAVVGRVRLGRPTRARMQLRAQNRDTSPAPRAGGGECPSVMGGPHTYIDGVCATCGRSAEVTAGARSQFFKCAGSDMVNSPAHYNQAGIECIDALTAATSGKSGIEAVCVANVIKYLWRYELKNGVEDVKKARWYLDRLIKEMEK